jgi:type IV pilus assembly protein PilQ
VEAKLSDIRSFIQKIDIPVRQIEISAQIVKTDLGSGDGLGFKVSGGGLMHVGRRLLGIGPTSPKARLLTQQNGGPVSDVNPTTLTPAATPFKVGDNSVNGQLWDGYFMDLASAGAGGGTFGFSLGRLPGGTMLDLELQALEYETRAKTVSRPKLITMDKVPASVEQGQDIPYQEASSSGATTTSFKQASLKLEVTPQITPDNKINMTLKINNDTPGEAVAGSAPPIKTNRLETSILVDNAETVVLGGILTDTQGASSTQVPFLGSIPFIGRLFRNTKHSRVQAETLIFLTPRILEPLTETAVR